MTEQTPFNPLESLMRRGTAVLVALVALIVVQVGAVVASSCSPKAQQYAAPVLAYAPETCKLYPAQSTEREVCDLSVKLADALDRLAKERAGEPQPKGSTDGKANGEQQEASTAGPDASSAEPPTVAPVASGAGGGPPSSGH